MGKDATGEGRLGVRVYLHDWMLDMTKRFRKTFGPRVKKLDLIRPVGTRESESVDEP